MLTFEDIPADVPELNRSEWLRLVNALHKKAIPGNWAWQRLVAEFGFSPDYSDADHGMHWSDNN